MTGAKVELRVIRMAIIMMLSSNERGSATAPVTLGVDRILAVTGTTLVLSLVHLFLSHPPALNPSCYLRVVGGSGQSLRTTLPQLKSQDKSAKDLSQQQALISISWIS